MGEKTKENSMAARKDYEQFAKELVDAVGGPDNIESVTNCITPEFGS